MLEGETIQCTQLPLFSNNNIFCPSEGEGKISSDNLEFNMAYHISFLFFFFFFCILFHSRTNLSEGVCCGQFPVLQDLSPTWEFTDESILKIKHHLKKRKKRLDQKTCSPCTKSWKQVLVYPAKKDLGWIYPTPGYTWIYLGDSLTVQDENVWWSDSAYNFIKDLAVAIKSWQYLTADMW